MAMKETTLVTSYVDGFENVMEVQSSMIVKKISMNQKSKQITIFYEETEDYESLPFGEVKALVEENGGKYTNKKDGVAFLNSL